MHAALLRPPILLLTAAVAFSASAIARADSADELVKSIYGEREREAIATRTFDDDLALANEILEVARTTTDGPDVIIALCEHVYALGSRRVEGFGVAADAMLVAAKNAGDQQSKFLDRAASAQQRLFTAARGDDRDPIARKLVVILRLCAAVHSEAERWTVAAQYLRRALGAANSARLPLADSLRRELLELQNRPRLLQRADQLKQTLKEDREDKAAANALIELYLVGLDRPDEARKYSFLSDDADLIEGVRLASTEPDQRTPEEHVAVGDLYLGLYEKAAPESRHRMLIRSYVAFSAFLDGAPADHSDRTKGELAVKQLQNQLETLGVDPSELYRPSAENRIELGFGEPSDLIGHEGHSVYRSSFSPDGKQIATAGSDGTVRIWDVATAREIHKIESHPAGAVQAAWSGDGRWIASMGGRGKFSLWSTSLRRSRADIQAGNRGQSIAITRDGRRVAAGVSGGTLRIWAPAASSKPVNCPIAGADEDTRVYGIAFSPDGRLLAAVGTWRGVTLYNADTGSRVAHLEGHWRHSYRVAFSPDGKWLASGGDDGTVRLYDVASRKAVGLIDRSDHDVHGLAFSGDGRLLAVAREDGTVRVLDVHFRTIAGSFDTGFETCYGITFDSLSQRLLATGKSPIAKVYPINRFYKPATEPVVRNLNLAYFWAEQRRIYEHEGGVLSIKDDDAALRQGFYAHAKGRYELRVRAYGELAGDEPPLLNIHIDDAEDPAKSFELANESDDPKTFIASLDLDRGGHVLGLHFPNDFFEGEDKDRNLHILSIELVGPMASQDAAPDEPSGDDEAAE